MPFRLVSADGQLSFELRAGLPLVLGRALSSDLPVLDPTVSRRHAELVADDKVVLFVGRMRDRPVPVPLSSTVIVPSGWKSGSCWRCQGP